MTSEHTPGRREATSDAAWSAAAGLGNAAGRWRRYLLGGTALVLSLVSCSMLPPPLPEGEGPGVVVVSRLGGGTVISEDGTLVCGQACQATFAQGSEVVLIAAPSTGTAVSWSAACAAATGERCVVDVAERTEVGVAFEPIGSPAIGPLDAIGCDGVGLGDTCEVRIGWSGAPGPHSGVELSLAGDAFRLVGARPGGDAADCFVAHGPVKAVMACDAVVDGGTDVMRLEVQRTGSLPAVVAIVEAYVAPDSTTKSSVAGGAFVAKASP